MKTNHQKKSSTRLIETKRVPVEWLHGLAIREGNSKKPIYQIHKWWARRLSSVFRSLLLMAINDDYFAVKDKFYECNSYDDLVVMDPFMGGGTSIVEASKLNARAIGVDIDPIAWFTTKKEVELFNSAAVKSAYESLRETVGRQISEYYITKVGRKIIPVTYFFWVDLIKCPSCKTIFETHPHYILSHEKNKQVQTVFCKHCHSTAVISSKQSKFVCKKCHKITEVNIGTMKAGQYQCPRCSHTGTLVSSVTQGKPLKKRLFALEFADEEGVRHYRATNDFDRKLYKKAQLALEKNSHSLPYPRQKIPAEHRSDARPINFGFEYYHQLFNARQLLCLSLLWKAIQDLPEDIKEYFVVAFSDSLTSNNLLCRYAFGYQKLTPLFSIHAYDIVHRPVENNVWGTKFGRGSFSKCFNKMARGKEYAEKPYELRYKKGQVEHVYTGERISRLVSSSLKDINSETIKCIILNQSSVDLESLPDNSVDLVLTDPPYYDNLSYSELSDFYYVWTRPHMPKDGNGHNHTSTPYKDALFAKNDLAKDRFVDDLTSILSHCSRALKQEGLMVFTFHHRRLRAWISLAQALAKGGFYVTNVFPVRSEGKSGFHSNEGTIKWDSVIVCRHRTDLKPGRRPRYSQKGVSKQFEYWKKRLNEENLPFYDVDALSFGYSLAMKSIIQSSSDPLVIESLMLEANSCLKEMFLSTRKPETLEQDP